MRRSAYTNLAYFDGWTVDQLADMELTDIDYMEIAALCFEWSRKYPHRYVEYTMRACDVLACITSGLDWYVDCIQRTLECRLRNCGKPWDDKYEMDYFIRQHAIHRRNADRLALRDAN